MQMTILPDADAVARQADTIVAAEAREAVAARGRCILAVSGGHTPWHMLGRFLKKNPLIQEVGAGLIKMSYLGHSGWRSSRFSTARIARLLSVTPFW